MSRLIPEDVILSVQQAADIFDVVSESVQLKKSGQGYMGLCPFHSEKTPSFHVNPQRGIYHCFGCGVGGDVISFMMKREGLSFPETVRMLAARYGISIPETDMSPSAKRAASERETLYKVNALAMEYFKRTLFEDNRAERARQYLKNRGIDGNTATTFDLGFAPDGWDNLIRFLTARNVPRNLVEKSGLIATKNGERYYDRFRNRIIFPIIDLSHRVIGFGGRVLDDSLPKYLNSPETPIYNKSKSLYGISKTKHVCRQTGTVHIVEGYFDLILLFMNGIENVVATLGTAITRDHVRMLSRGGAKRFVLVFDSDAAGINAAVRSIPVFQKEFIDANVLILPKGHDPDSFVREFGPGAFREASDNARSIISFLLDSAVETHGLSIEGRIRIIEDMKEPIRAVDDPVARSLYIRDVAHRIGVEEAAVLEKINMGHKPPASVNIQNGQGQPTRLKSRYMDMEKQIVSMMIQFPEILDVCRETGVVGYIENSHLKTLGNMILEYKGDPENMAPGLVAQAVTDIQRQMISSLAVGDVPWIYKNCVGLIHQYIGNRQKREDSLSAQIKRAEENHDQDLLLRLMQKKYDRMKAMKNKVYTQKDI